MSGGSKKTGALQEFHDLFHAQTGEEWQDYQNDELVVDSLIPDLAHQMYPTLFKTPTAFTTATSDFIYLLDDRVQEMIDIIRDATARTTSSSSLMNSGNTSAGARISFSTSRAWRRISNVSAMARSG